MSSQPSLQSFAHVLHTCRLERNQAYALRLHTCMCDWGLDASPWLGNNLVSVLAEAGIVSIAWNVFLRLTHRTVCSWNSVITGFTQLGNSNHALNLYKRMQEDSIIPNDHTYVALLRACTELKAVGQGSKIHAEISVKRTLERNLHINSMLIHMYARCGLLIKAQEVFDKLPSPNVVVWNALIAGYAKREIPYQALYCFKRMHEAGIPPNAITFVCVLKACGSIGIVEKGQEIHAETARKNLLDSNPIIQGALVDMYAKCGSLVTAQEVFDKLPTRSLVVWTSLISGYAKYEFGREALNCFEQMRLEGISPNSVTFACSLKACSIIGAVDKGNEIYSEVLQMGLLNGNPVVGNALIDMYIKCGLLARAEEVFDELPSRDVVSWNALMAGYVKYELYETALDCFSQMIREDHCPDAVTYIFTLKSCGIIGSIERAVEIHAEVARQGVLHKDIMVGNAMIDTYANCGNLTAAQEVFDGMLLRDVVSWTALISGYAGQEHSGEALECYKQMQVEGVHPNAITYICILKACGSSEDEHSGQLIHAVMVGNELLERDPSVSSALIDMYANCGLLSKAKEVFDKIPLPNEILWNTMLAGYANHEHCEEALCFFDMMTLNGFSPDKVTYLSCLKACGRVEAADQGTGIHHQVAANGLLETESAIGNAVIDMYARCGQLVKAQDVLRKVPVGDTACWTALMAGYIKHGHGEGALNCLEKMEMEGVLPNFVTYGFGLKACASVGAAGKGQEIYSEIARQGLLEREQNLSASLIDMYTKCGQPAKAQEVFDKSASQSVVLWNTLISGYAKLDRFAEAIQCFERMQGKGFSPDDVTFLNILGACNHAGLVDEGYSYFRTMSKDHDISPAEKHQCCMVDLLGRTGSLEEANQFMRMIYCSSSVVQRSMLCASQKSGSLNIGKTVFDSAVGFCQEGIVQEESPSAWETNMGYSSTSVTDYDILNSTNKRFFNSRAHV